MPSLVDRRKTVRELYRGTSGFLIPAEEPKVPWTSLATWCYGELTPTGVQKMLDYLRLTPCDVFYDLGAGTGKVVIQAAISVRLKKCVGIELVPERFQQAQPILRQARKQKLILAKTCRFLHADLFTADLSDATVLYVSSTLFTAGMMHALYRKLLSFDRELRIVTLKEFSEPPGRLNLVDILRLNANWHRGTKAHVYRVTPRSK